MKNKKTYVKKKMVPVIQAVIANEPNNQVNFGSTLTATRAKLSAEETAVWNWANAVTTDFILLGA